MSFTYASVIEAIDLSSRLRRIALRIDDPQALAVEAADDSAVGVYFDADPSSEGRNYSVRYHRGDRIDLDIFLHDGGPGASWARTARVGDRVGLDHARSWYAPPSDNDWQLLIADLSGLPALARIIEGLPGDARVTAIAEVAEAADLAYLPAHPGVALIPSIGSGNGRTPSELAGVVRKLVLPAGRGYCWFAGEAAESRSVRKDLRSRGWSMHQYDITGYWRAGSKEWDVRFALVEDQVLAVYERALAEGRGDKAAAEEFDDALEEVGL